ncbi:unnamed protein product [Orchesella dallaii]|uniref:Uncharacterized protein n=1 Tax=Orchesella dallaii TaxID=48710 RepID=A0ABP1R0A7_9HEXA
MKQWLIRDDIMTHFDGRKHNALLMDLSSNPIAIRSYNIFTITYGFIGNFYHIGRLENVT